MSEFKMVPLGQLMLVSGKKGGRPDVKPLIQRALEDADVMKQVGPYVSNGGMTGRRSIDDVRALDAVMAHDDKRGGHIRASLVPAQATEEDRAHGLTEAEVMDAFFVVIRRFYTLKNHRVVDFNHKRVAGLSITAA